MVCLVGREAEQQPVALDASNPQPALRYEWAAAGKLTDSADVVETEVA